MIRPFRDGSIISSVMTETSTPLNARSSITSVIFFPARSFKVKALISFPALITRSIVSTFVIGVFGGGN